MLKIVVLNKNAYSFYDRLTSFCTLKVDTDHGPFIFQFKEDRRRISRSKLMTKTYIVELVPPPELGMVSTNLNEKIVLAIKIILLKPKYEVLTQVLVDVYIESMLEENAKSKGFF